MNDFSVNNQELLQLIELWEPTLLALNEETITQNRNSQNRTIKQILGHMVDSANNNTLRIINLQNLPSPLAFPDYASLGSNDKWIAIQNFQNESWSDLVQLWKFANKHIVHVIDNVDATKLENIWITATKEEVSLKQMINGYLGHFKLHLNEINELISKQ